MKLHYRGAEYEVADNAIESIDSGLVGQYRGAKLSVRVPKQVVAHRKPAGMKYRGATIE
jgi:hypothetical protein